MSANSKIEWCDHTFNPWTGCTKVSPQGCAGCYAEAWSKRAGAKVGKWGPGAPRVRTTPANWKLPYKWDAIAEAFQAEHGRRQRVFCASLADVFDNEAPVEWRMDLFKLIADTPNLDWLLLTKRIGNVLPQLKEAGMHCISTDKSNLAFWIMSWFDGRPPANVWLGATVVNQDEADRDIPKLLAVPAAKRFLSMEPLLGPVDLTTIDIDGHSEIFPLRGTDRCEDDDGNPAPDLPALDWVIAGGESGPGARPSHPDWHRTLRDQCAAAGVPFLFKQWGEYVDRHGGRGEWLGNVHTGEPDLHLLSTGRVTTAFESGATALHRVGKKAAGRLLDGIEHNGFPK